MQVGNVGIVGIVGIGCMGGAMAQRLLEQGWSVGVHDIDRERTRQAVAWGAEVHASAAALAASHDTVLIAVVDAAQTWEVLFGPSGAAAALAPGSTVVLCPTIGPADVEQVATRLSTFGIGCIDAPMSGGPVRARQGRMSLMVACDDALFARHLRLLADLADPVFRVSQQPGDGARTKLVNNLLAAVNLAGAAEALALASRLGLDGPRTLSVIAASSGQSWIGGERMARALSADPAVHARVALLAKDAALALDMAASVELSMPLGFVASAAFQQAVDAGLADADDSALYAQALRSAGGGSENEP